MKRLNFSYHATILLLGMMPTCSSLVFAQASSHSQASDNSDICTGRDPSRMDTADMWACAMSAQSNGDNYAAMMKWYLHGAQRGDWEAQYQLGNMFERKFPYERGVGLPVRNLVEAYKWYDVAATVKGEYVDRLPPTSSVIKEDNRAEIKSRDFISKSMSALQIEEAQELSRNWISQHRIAIDRQIASSIGSR